MDAVFPIPLEGWGFPDPRRNRAMAYGGRRSYEIHQGVDIPAPEGTPVRAAGAGRVVLAVTAYRPGWRGYGRCCAIDHGDGTWSFYAHLSRLVVARGQEVHAGEVIGAVGTTKWTTPALESFHDSGAHLHFEIMTRFPPNPRRNKFSIVDRSDPVTWFEGRGIRVPFVTFRRGKPSPPVENRR